MRFKVDENLPVEVAELLRDHQYDAMTVVEQRLAGLAGALWIVDERRVRIRQSN